MWNQACNRSLRCFAPSKSPTPSRAASIKRSLMATTPIVVKNGKGFWVHQFRDGNVIRRKGLGSAARGTLAQLRRAREAFALARRKGLELSGVRPYTPPGDWDSRQGLMTPIFHGHAEESGIVRVWTRNGRNIATALPDRQMFGSETQRRRF